MFKFNLQQALIHQKFGSSHDSNVYPYLEGQDDKKWVIKCIHVNDPQKINSILQNVLLATNANSASVVPIKGHDIQKDDQGNTTIYLKMPRMQQNLSDVIRHYQGSKQTVVPLEKIVHYFHLIVSCLDELAQKQIAHRNLKPSNVLIDRDGHVYLSDLRTSDYSDSNDEDSLYKAPETFFENWAVTDEDLHKADIWSLGMIIAKACLGDTLIPISSDLPIKDNKDNIDQNISLIAYRYGRHFEGIIKELLALNPRDRETLSSIRKLLEETFPQYIAGSEKNVARGPYANSEQKSVYIRDQPQRSFRDLKEESPFLSDSTLEIDQQSSSVDTSFLLWNEHRRINWPDWIQLRRPEWLNRPRVIHARLQLNIWLRKGKEWVQMNRHLAVGILASLVLLIIILVSMSPSNTARQEKFSDMMRDIQLRYSNSLKIEYDPKGGLIFTTMFQLNDDILNSVMHEVINKLQSENYIDYLQHFKFVSGIDDVTDAGLQQFGDSLLFLKNLKSLSLERIGGYRTTVYTIQNLVEKISNGLKNIESFCIGMEQYGSGMMDLTNGNTQRLVISALRNMKKLTAFHLFLDYINISDGELQLVGETLSEYGKNLKTLFIRFSNNPYIPIYTTSNGLQQFHSQILSKVKKLSKLDVAYTNVTPMTDQVLDTLSTDLTSYGNNLKILSLSFENCISITDAGLKIFGYHLSQNKLKNLKYLSLKTSAGNEVRSWLRQELKYIPELHIRPE